jgi:hypothetical protein
MCIGRMLWTRSDSIGSRAASCSPGWPAGRWPRSSAAGHPRRRRCRSAGAADGRSAISAPGVAAPEVGSVSTHPANFSATAHCDVLRRVRLRCAAPVIVASARKPPAARMRASMFSRFDSAMSSRSAAPAHRAPPVRYAPPAPVRASGVLPTSVAFRSADGATARYVRLTRAHRPSAEISDATSHHRQPVPVSSESSYP